MSKLGHMSVEQVREWISAANAVTVFTGAGVSTESGIPDYRGPSGAWTTDPDAAKYVDIEYYLHDRQIREHAWLRRKDHPAWTVEPNSAHHALLGLERAGKLLKLVTQNIDGLHQKAGQDPASVLEMHGNIFGVVCVGCAAESSMEEALGRVADGESDPSCLACGGVLKSTTVFFGERLDEQMLHASAAAAAECEVFVAVGTSLTVHPAAGLVDIAANSGARVVICNAEPTPYDRFADAVLRDPIGQVLPAIMPT